MKKIYLRPEIETVNVQSEGFIAWSGNDETGNMPLLDGTASGSESAVKDFGAWDFDEEW